MLEFIAPTKATLKSLSDLGADKIVFINLDAVTGPIYTPLISSKFGKVDIVHQLREGRLDWNDFEFIRDAHGVLLTCWDSVRTLEAVKEYNKRFKVAEGKVRVYDLGVRLV